MEKWLILSTIGLPWVGGLCNWGLRDRHLSLQHALAALFSLAGGLASIGLLFFTSSETVLSISLGGAYGEFTLVADGLGVYLAIIASIIGSLAVIFSSDYMKGEAQISRYYALVLLFIGAMCGLVLAGSLLLMFIFWEITAFCSYALISFHNDDPKAVAGGIQALIMTQLGGIGLLVGALITYAYLGSYQVSALLSQADSLPSGVLAVLAFGFLAAAIAKSAQFPFQNWLPGAMEAPTPVSALIHAATMVNAGVYLLARFYPAFDSVPGWKIAVISVGLISALLGAFLALNVNDLKCALAYSTISQLGYMVYGIGCGAILASQFHLLSHAIFKALLFLGAGAVIHAVGTRDMRQMGGLRTRMPFTRTVFVIGALGLAGIPIANGFFSKELLLESGLAEGPLWAYAGMLLGVCLTAAYSLRMVTMVFYGSARGALGHPAPGAMRISLSTLSFGVLTSWLLAGPFSLLLANSLPFHSLHTASTGELIREITTSPASWLALGVVAVGLAAWQYRSVFRTAQSFWLARLADSGFGFEPLNQWIIRLTRAAADLLGKTQTGQLNWNVFAIVTGLAGVLLLILIGV